MDATASSAAFRVRRANASDSALLAAFGARTFVGAFAADNDPGDLERYVAEAFSEERTAAELAERGSTFLLAYDDAFAPDAPVGYARLLTGAAEDGIPGERAVELVRLYVDPDVTGRGYGAALLQACLDEAARGGCDVIWLGVWEHNHGARRFYQRWGFREVGTHTFVLGREAQTDQLMARPVAG